MAQQTSLPEEPQAGAPRTSPPVSSAVPASPTKSLWKRLLNHRSANTHPEQPVKSSSAEHPASVPSNSSGVAPAPELSAVSEARVSPGQASSELDADDSAQLLNGANIGDPVLGCDGGPASKTSSNSRRAHRDVVPGLPRAQTFARQQSELRGNLLPIIPTPAERRGASADRRLTRSVSSPTSSQVLSNPRTSAPNVSCYLEPGDPDLAVSGADAAPKVVPPAPSVPSLEAITSSSRPPTDVAVVDDTTVTTDRDQNHDDIASAAQPTAVGSDHGHDGLDNHSIAGEITKEAETHHIDAASMTSSQYEHRIRYELEHVWILNLSMHFRDKSRREKFFVTYRQRPDLSRRVTISLDYRNAPEGSLEMDLLDTKLQRDKNEMIYEAIRESLVDIQFYNTVTNLKLQTTDGRLHVHVVEDTTEIINYPSNQHVQHLGCRKIRESDVEFDSHMSGFVYKVRVNGRVLIKKEIPGPDSVDEFLYEVNALNFLRDSQNVIELYGVIIGDDDRVRGLLISYAEQGALIDIIYENNHGIPWYTRMKWARQIVHGLSEIHEAGFVQGDFTLSNIVIDDDGNAKIIDINRRGCPVGWEPPEATPLIQSDQRISMYIGVKSDLYQLGMVLWALATQDDDPESHGRPLHLGGDVGVPQWYRSIVETCLAEDPRDRAQALQLLGYFPSLKGDQSRLEDSDYGDDWVEGPHHPAFYAHSAPSGSVDDGYNSFRNRATGIESVPSVGDNADEVEHFAEDSNFPAHKFDLTPLIRTVTPTNDWAYVNFGHTYVDPSNGVSNEPYYFPTRGRSPPRVGTTYDPTRRAASWERSRSPGHEHPGSDRPQKKQIGRSPSPSLRGWDPESLTKADDEVDVANAAETERRESTSLANKISGIEKTTSRDVDDERPDHTSLAETEVKIRETEASAANNKDTADSCSPEYSEGPHYSLGDEPLAREALPPATQHTPENGDLGNNLLDQITSVGAVYEEAYPRCLDLHDDEKKDTNDDRHYRVGDELNALITT